MATIKGENLRVLLGDDVNNLKCVAAATSCTVHLQLQVEEDTTKDTDDDWIYTQPVGINWDMQVEALILDDDDEYRTDAVNANDLQVGRVYNLRFAQTSGNQNREVMENRLMLTGLAILSDLTDNSPNQDLSTFTAQFTGTGDLAPYSPNVKQQTEETQ